MFVILLSPRESPIPLQHVACCIRPISTNLDLVGPGLAICHNNNTNNTRQRQSEVAVRQAEADRLSAQIGQHEARAQGAGGGGGGAAALRAEYQVLEKSVGSLRREKDNLQQDLEISNMNPKEVRVGDGDGRREWMLIKRGHARRSCVARGGQRHVFKGPQ